MTTYVYEGSYMQLQVQEPLDQEGILTGQYGKLHFKRCADGFAIYDSFFPGTGMVCGPTSANLGFPESINNIPVTEIHQTIRIGSAHPIAIEGKQLKRVYLNISLTDPQQEAAKATSLAQLFSVMLQQRERNNRRQEDLEISLDFYTEKRVVDFCRITCDQKCILNPVPARQLQVNAPVTVLKGQVFEQLEAADFNSQVYPYTYDDWDGQEQNIRYFAGAKKLRSVDGALLGDVCWCFTDCTALESVHLSNGILNVPARAFQNCACLKDLYLPDTVTELGEYALDGCTALETVHLPANLKKIPKGLFRNCRKLKKCFLADTIEVIEDEAFAGCSALRRPWIPKAIRVIGETAFDDPSWRIFP